MACQSLTSDKIVHSDAFGKAIDQVFDKMDRDKSGSLERDELIIAICHVHFKLVKHVPGLTAPPTSDALDAFIAEYDADLSGGLSREEFAAFARAWLAKDGGAFVGRVVLSSMVSMVLLPGLAGQLRRAVPGGGRVPEALFKVGFGVVFKVVMTVLGR